VSGKAPAGWAIVEYHDGAGSTNLVGNVTYSGLTGLAIQNPEGVVVFKLEGIYGIGGPYGCFRYFQFADDSPAYLAEVQDINLEWNWPPLVMVDLTSASYQEYMLFDVRVRRIGTTLYWDRYAGDAYFQAGCGMMEHIFVFTNLQFTGDSWSLNGYRYTINRASPESDLLILDEILKSLAAR
jgi:hypothetical protein